MQFTQQQFRDLRENPDPALIDFVKSLVPGRWYGTTEAWEAYNGKKTFPDGPTFRYAFHHAGGQVVNRRVRRAPLDGL